MNDTPLRQCPACDYPLDGLPDRHSCPECGFEYDKRSSMRRESGAEAKTRKFLFVVGCYLCLTGCVALFSPKPDLGLVVILLGAIFVFSTRRSHWPRIVLAPDHIVIIKRRPPHRIIPVVDISHLEFSSFSMSVRIRDLQGKTIAKISTQSFPRGAAQQWNEQILSRREEAAPEVPADAYGADP